MAVEAKSASFGAFAPEAFVPARAEAAIQIFVSETRDAITKELRTLGDLLVTSDTPDEILRVFVGGYVDPTALRERNQGGGACRRYLAGASCPL